MISREATIELRRLDYDIATAQKKILEAGLLPAWLSGWPSEGKDLPPTANRNGNCTIPA
jgi:hypothetical protein